MLRTYSTLLLLTLSTGTAIAQEDAGEKPNPCTLLPIYHCAEQLDTGLTVGHFGYNMQCPEGLENIPDLYVPIGDDNYFSPDPKDRGQPTNFLPGRHADEFEVEFTAEEIRKAKDLHWSVLKISASVDFSKTRDEDLDCSHPSY